MAEQLPNASLMSLVPTFSGKGPDKFFSTLESVQKLANWSEDHLFIITTLVLEGQASRYYQDVLKPLKLTEYTELKDKFLTYFLEDTPFSAQLARFTSCVQGASETVRDFAARLEGHGHRTLSSTLPTHTMSVAFKEEILLSQFMSGLIPNIRSQVIILNPKTFVEARTIAMRVEDSIAVTAQAVNAVHIPAQNENFQDFANILQVTTKSYTDALDRTREQIDALRLQVEKLAVQPRQTFDMQPRQTFDVQPRQTFDMNRRKPPIKCFYCAKLGHIVRDCRKRQRDIAQGNCQNKQQNSSHPNA